MTKYRINKCEITGKKGVRMYKNQVIDQKQFVDGSIDYLVSTGAISAVKNEEIPKKAEKGSKKAEKDEKEPENPQ
jgi:hypothetical protein